VSKDPFSQLRGLRFMQSRIPVLDGLTTFVRDNEPLTGSVKETLEQRFSRWYPQEGGHKVVLPYEGGEYDPEHFRLEEKVWDHEHCRVCGESIPAMTLCWVTQEGPFIVLCTDCKEQMDAVRTIGP
jgi:hypothetical protein